MEAVSPGTLSRESAARVGGRLTQPAPPCQQNEPASANVRKGAILGRRVVSLRTVLFVVAGCVDRAPPTAPPEPEARTEAGIGPVVECSLEPPYSAADILRTENLSYAPPDGYERRLDLVTPSGAGLHPLVVLFHAGGWANGDEDQLAAHTLRLARHGYAAASVRYRLANRSTTEPHRYPAAISDARCALRFLARIAADHHIDGRRVITWGFSAGGHVAALLGLQSDKIDEDDGSCPEAGDLPSVVGVGAYYGVYDLRTQSPIGAYCHRIVDNFLGPAANGEARWAASPVTRVSTKSPAFMLVHGTADTVVRVESARAFRNALQRANGKVTYIELPRRGHGIAFLDPAAPQRSVDCTVLAFLERHLVSSAR